jgi:hypothetical protein
MELYYELLPQFNERLNIKRDNFCKELISNYEEDRYQCKKCEKVFCAENYAINHIKLKHSEDLEKEVDEQVIR